MVHSGWRSSTTWGAVLVASAAVFCSSCGDGKVRKATVPVEGKVFWKSEKTPAVHAQVVFRPKGDPKPEDWPDGFPRATVGADGSFKLTTYQNHDGAPEGEYDVLLHWPLKKRAQKEEDEERPGEDRLEGRYTDTPHWQKRVAPGNQDPKEFIFILK